MTSLLDIPSGVDWKGDHASLERFLEAIYHWCPVSSYLQCGKKKEKACTTGLCGVMTNQALLDKWLFMYKTTDPELRNRTVEKEGNWS